MATKAYRDAIASIESDGSGGYSAIGPTNSKMGRALGRYQIMESNIEPWSREALGYAVTPDVFLANPDIQDAIFDKKFGGYVNQFGPEGAAQAWFAGPGGVGKTDRKDVLGTDVGTYGRKFTNALGIGSKVASQEAAAPQLSGTPVPAMADPITVGSMAPQTTQAQPTIAGGISDFQNGNYLQGADQVLGSISGGSGGGQIPQTQPMQLSPSYGNNASNALGNYIAALLGKKDLTQNG